MTIAFDAQTSANITTAATSKSWSHTCSGNDRYLFVCASFSINPGSAPTATYNGVSMTLLYNSGNQRVIFGLKNPDSGAHNAVVNFGSTTNAVFSAVSFTGVYGVRTGASNSASGTSVSVNATTVADTMYDDLVFDAWFTVVENAAAPSVGAGQTQRVAANLNYSSTFYVKLYNSTEPGAHGGGTTAMSWSTSYTASQFIHAIPLKPAQRVPGSPAVSPTYLI